MDRSIHLHPDRDYAINEDGVYMHDMIAETMLGRPLHDYEWVDHLSDNGLDNRRANIIIFKDTPNGPVEVEVERN